MKSVIILLLSIVYITIMIPNSVKTGRACSSD